MKLSPSARIAQYVPFAGGAASADSAGGSLASFVRRVGGSFGLQVVSAVLQLITAVLLARLLGPADYGVYALAMVYANLFGLAACLGFPQLLVREVARLVPRSDWAGVRRLVGTAQVSALAGALFLAAVGALLVPHLVSGEGAGGRTALLFAMLLVIPIALQRIGETTLFGFEQPIAANMPERLVRPLVMVLLVAGLLFASSAASSAATALAAQGAAYLVSLVSVVWLVRRRTPNRWWTGRRVLDPQLLRQSLPLLSVALLTLVSTRLDIMMLGWIGDVADAGQYRLASQLAVLPLMVAITAQSIVSPVVSRQYAAGESHRLRPQLRRLALGSALVALLLSLIVFAAFKPLLAIIGSSFAPAGGPLIVLLVAYTVSAATFHALPLLTMTGHVRDVAVANVVAIAVNAGLNVVLIPAYGATGTALATLVSLVVLNGLHLWNAHNRLAVPQSRNRTSRPS